LHFSKHCWQGKFRESSTSFIYEESALIVGTKEPSGSSSINVMNVFHDSFLLVDDPLSAEQFHQEYNPPVEGSYTGMNKQEKIVPVTDPSNDREQVQQRFVRVSITLLLCLALHLIVLFIIFDKCY